MAAHTIAQKLIETHLVEGEPSPGNDIGLRIDQTLTQDATGTLVMLELEALGVDRVHTELSVQYVDHNLIQEDYKNADDHLFLLSAARRFGLWYSRPGNGVSHPLHQQYFGVPGKTLLGADSHTCAAGALGMLAMGAGGIDVAMAMAGEPFHIRMPRILGIRLVGNLPEWVSAKDIILELLRRRGVSGGRGTILEYFGPGLDELSAMDRHVIANMGIELGSTASVFPSDSRTRDFLDRAGRADDWIPLTPDNHAEYDEVEEIVLNDLEPLMALPTSPDNVVPVREMSGKPFYQAYIGSSANPGYRDFAMAAEIVRGRTIAPWISLDVNPVSRSQLADLTRNSAVLALINAGARIHQAGCNGCIGMGQAPATHEYSLRTVPRNFPGRSGTPEDKVCLVSPETAAASAIRGVISDPRELAALGVAYPRIDEPRVYATAPGWFEAPPPAEEAKSVRLRLGPNIKPLPEFDELPDELEVPIILKVGDNISTDEILPAGTRVLPFRSNIERISDFAFEMVDAEYVAHAKETRERGGHAIVGGANYGQGSSREHAALAPRFLGLRAVFAESFARIHFENLINFGVLPLVIDRDTSLDAGLVVRIRHLREQLREGDSIEIDAGTEVRARCDLSDRQRAVLLAGGLINWYKRERGSSATVAAEHVQP